MGLWSSGYDVCLTRRRPGVRTSLGPFLIYIRLDYISIAFLAGFILCKAYIFQFGLFTIDYY